MFSFYNQGNKVKMAIEEYIFTRGHNGRRGSPRVNPGTKIYVIKYEGNRGYYPFSYLHKEQAEECIQNSEFYKTNSEFYCQWNKVTDPELTMHVGR